MKTQRLHKTRTHALAVSALVGALTALAPLAHAANGTWTNVSTASDWGITTNWTGEIVADGIGSIATISAPSPNATLALNLDTDITLGGITYNSPGATTATGWNIGSTSARTLTLATGTVAAPVLNVRGTQTISAVMLGSQGFSKTSGGKLTVSGANTYTGVTTVSDGNLTVGSASGLGALGVGNGTVISRGDSGQFPQLHFTSNVTTAEDIAIRIGYSSGTAGATTGDNMLFNDGGTTTLSGATTLVRATNAGTNNINVFGVQSGPGTLAITGTVAGSLTGTQATGTYVDANRLRLRTTATNANIDISGAISDGNIGTGGVSVYSLAGSTGIVRLSGANTYTGSTTHLAGRMLINNNTGSGTGLGLVDVASGATFGGTGIVAPGAANGVLFRTGSIVAPGDLTSAGAVVAAGESLGFNLADTTGAVTFESGASIHLDLAVGAPTVAESFIFTGLAIGQKDIHFNGNQVNFSITGGILADGLYTLAIFDAADAYDGQLTLGTGLAGYTAALIHNTNNIQLQIGTAIPEPSSFAVLGGLAALACGVVSRRRR